MNLSVIVFWLFSSFSLAAEGSGFFRSIESLFLYVPTKEHVPSPKDFNWPYEDVFLQSGPARIHGWLFSQENSRAALLYFHGNGGNISHRLEKIAMFKELGLSVFIIDYRGYGKSSGVPSEAGLYEDARQAFLYLTEVKKIAPARIIIFGESLGSAVAVELASHAPAGGLILENALTSLAALARHLYPPWAAKLLVQSRFDSLSKIDRVNEPLVVMSSRDDEIVPFEQGVELYDKATAPKEFVILGGGHNDSFYLSWPKSKSIVKDFVERSLSQNP